MINKDILRNLVNATNSLLNYVDAIPSEAANSFPAMPGCDRDEIEADIGLAISFQKEMANATVTIDGTQLVCAIRIRIHHRSLSEFSDWLAGQYAIAKSTGFLNAARSINDSGKNYTDAYYLYKGDPKDVLPALPAGQSYVWICSP